MSNDFHKRVLALNYSSAEAAEMMRRVWAPTPFMADVYTGSHSAAREREMIEWCFTEYGQESSPLRKRPGPQEGRWRRGGVTIYGWTWWGFATQAELDGFVARWPAPDGHEPPTEL